MPNNEPLSPSIARAEQADRRAAVPDADVAGLVKEALILDGHLGAFDDSFCLVGNERVGRFRVALSSLALTVEAQAGEVMKLRARVAELEHEIALRQHLYDAHPGPNEELLAAALARVAEYDKLATEARLWVDREAIALGEPGAHYASAKVYQCGIRLAALTPAAVMDDDTGRGEG